jgi:hypothetical protein
VRQREDLVAVPVVPEEEVKVLLLPEHRLVKEELAGVNRLHLLLVEISAEVEVVPEGLQ